MEGNRHGNRAGVLGINGRRRCERLLIVVKARELYDHRKDAAEDVRYAETVNELEKVREKGWEGARA